MKRHYHVLFWRDIPSMVKGKDGRKRISKPLSDRFMEAIDAAAMRTGDTDTDEYLEHWQASESKEIQGDADELLSAVAAQLEVDYPREKLLELIKNGGWKQAPETN